MDQDGAFMSWLMNYFFKKFDIVIKTVAPYDHHSLQAEHDIMSLSMILTKNLMGFGVMWPKYFPLATFPYNTFNGPNSKLQLIWTSFSRRPKLLLGLETNPDIKVSSTFKDYYMLLKKVRVFT